MSKCHAVMTRRVYREEDLWKTEEWSMPKLKGLATYIWEREAPASWRRFPPKVVAGRGKLYNGRLLSFCCGRSYIELCRNQRDPKVLVHELAHALVGGYTCKHNPTFVAKRDFLLRKYRIKVERRR